MIELIIFDWDDVFTKGSTEGYYKCYHEAIAGVGVSLGPEEEKQRIAAKWGASHEEELGELLKEKPELVSQASKLYEDYLFGDTFVDCLSVVPGSIELLNRLANKYTLALATGVHPKVLKERIMPKFNVPNVFAQIVTAYDLDDPTHAKPHPFIAQEIMRAQNITPEHAVMVGDAGNDVRMAQTAGIEPIVVLTGHLNREQALRLGVKHIIPDVTYLEDVLSRL
jgi:phosphoglycolate phosphatase